jgi:hypothetical protein
VDHYSGSFAWAQTGQSNPGTVRLIESIQGPACKVQPSDLTRISARNGGSFPLARIEKIISDEEQLPAGHGTREMPLWGPILSQIGSGSGTGAG